MCRPCGRHLWSRAATLTVPPAIVPCAERPRGAHRRRSCSPTESHAGRGGVRHDRGVSARRGHASHVSCSVTNRLRAPTHPKCAVACPRECSCLIYNSFSQQQKVRRRPRVPAQGPFAKNRASVNTRLLHDVHELRLVDLAVQVPVELLDHGLRTITCTQS